MVLVVPRDKWECRHITPFAAGNTNPFICVCIGAVVPDKDSAADAVHSLHL